MKITKEADYAMRIMLLLTRTDSRMEAKQISERCDIPYRFALKIMRKLVQSNLAKSYRGINGGYAVNDNHNAITLLDVVEAIDGEIAINTCIDNPTSCKSAAECKIKKSLLDAQTVFADKLRHVTFSELAK